MSAAYEASRACMNRFLAETDSDGWLHSCFHTAVNLFFPLPPHGTGRLVTLLAPERDLVPDSLILPADAFAAVQRLPAAGQVKKEALLYDGKVLPWLFPLEMRGRITRRFRPAEGRISAVRPHR